MQCVYNNPLAGEPYALSQMQCVYSPGGIYDYTCRLGPNKAGDARLMAAEIVKHRAEIDRWKAQAFAPLGDNHHNALLCPHCNPEGRRFA